MFPSLVISSHSYSDINLPSTLMLQPSECRSCALFWVIPDSDTTPVYRRLGPVNTTVPFTSRMIRYSSMFSAYTCRCYVYNLNCVRFSTLGVNSSSDLSHYSQIIHVCPSED